MMCSILFMFKYILNYTFEYNRPLLIILQCTSIHIHIHNRLDWVGFIPKRWSDNIIFIQCFVSFRCCFFICTFFIVYLFNAGCHAVRRWIGHVWTNVSALSVMPMSVSPNAIYSLWKCLTFSIASDEAAFHGLLVVYGNSLHVNLC